MLHRMPAGMHRTLLSTAGLLLLVGAYAEPAQDVGVRFTVLLAGAGKISAGVYDGGGRLRRSLSFLAEKPNGAVEVYWDGLDDFGEPLKPGSYTVRVVVSNARLRYVMTIANGIQPSDPSDHGGVHAGLGLCADEKGNVWLLGQMGGEVPRNVQCVTPEGKRVKSLEPIFGGTVGAVDDRFVYLLSGNGVYRLDIESGKEVDYPGGPRGMATFPDTTSDTYPRAHSMALLDGKLYIAVPWSDTIQVMDAATGELGRALPVPGVHAVAAGPGGRLYALVRNTLVVMNTEGTEQKTLARGLRRPSALAVDRSGVIWVIEDGAFVTKLSPEGRELLRLGQKGTFYTAEDGKVEPTRFLGLSAIAVDRRGDVYLAEPGLGRVQKFRADGAYQWSQTAIYAEEMCVDPRYPEEFYGTAGSRQLRRYILDYDKPGWRFDAVWNITLVPGKFMTVGMRVFSLAGKRFLAVWDAGLLRTEGYRLVPLKMEPLPITDEQGVTWHVETKDKQTSVYRWPPAGLDDQGAPVYREADKQLLAALDTSWNQAHSVQFQNVYHLSRASFDEAGNLYIMAGEPGASGGVGYWQRMYKQAYFQKYNTKGELVWNIGRHAESWANPGEFYMPNRVNVHRGFAYVTDVSGLLSIFDSNGLLVAFEIKDAYRGHSLASDLYGGGGESWVAYPFTNSRNGKTYYIIQDHGEGAYRLFEVQGLDALQTWQGEVELVTPAPAKPREAEQKQRLFSAQIYQARQAPTIDGDLAEWSDTGTETLWMKEGDPGLPHATLRYRYDSRNLYIAAHVRNDDSPAVNAYAADRDLMWRADALELYIGSDFSTWRKNPYTEHDFQFMFAVGEKMTGQAYCWTRHEWVEGSQSAYRVDADGKGYALEALLPWEYMKYAPQAGDKLGFDMRVMMGNADGTQFVSNLIWSATNMAFNQKNEWGMALLQGFYAEP